MITAPAAWKNKALLWGFVFFSLLPWFYFRIQQTVHPDMLWLYEAMTRIFNGGTMSDVAFETNPPLSLMLYTLPVMLKEYFGLPFHLTGIAQSFAILLAGGLMLARALKNFAFLDESKRTLLLVGFVLINTVCSSIVFGERDHLIGIILPAFVLLQLSLTFNLSKPRLPEWLYFALGALIILLKPHYGLIPALFLLHRLIIRRNLSLLRDPDFLALTTMTLGYAATVWFFFHDYLTVILPDVLSYYVPGSTGFDGLHGLTIFGAIGIALFLAARFLIKDRSERNLHFYLIGCGLVCLIPVIVQGKWLPYHYLPAAVFFGCLTPRYLFSFLQKEFKQGALALFFTAAAFTGLSYLVAPIDLAHARHDTYANLPLPRTITSYTDESPHKSFYLFNSDIALAQELSYYTGLKHASRFPSLWFLPALYYYEDQRQAGNLNAAETETLQSKKDHYAEMISEDINRDEPAIIALLDPDYFENKIDPVAFFKDNASFREMWSHYKPAGKIEILDSDYYGRAVKDTRPKTFYLYERQD